MRILLLCSALNRLSKRVQCSARDAALGVAGRGVEREAGHGTGHNTGHDTGALPPTTDRLPLRPAVPAAV